MCGIAGFIDFKRKSSKIDLINMTDILHHRGADDSGYSFFDINNVCIGMGHRRLSVLDLTKHGHQPMQFESLEIVYNGEVYNFNEIKNELEQYGYIFESYSDTEVILKAYHKWGINAVNKFNGMFAISIFDRNINKVILIRDRVGVKPLYWYFNNGLFMFSSELKSFHQHNDFTKHINKDALALYLQLSYIPQPHTIFNDTYKLEAGCYLEIDLNNKNINKQQYWDVISYYNKPKLDIGDNEAIDKVEELFISSFNYRMISDVPVGVFLSGGYDSSTVAAIVQNQQNTKLNTYTIGFDHKDFDESKYANNVAKHLGTNHTEYFCTQKEALNIIPTLSEIYDEPFGDSSTIPTILVSQLAKKDVTVSLSADGGDELFAGYNKYDTFLRYHSISKKLDKLPSSVFLKCLNKINPQYIPLFNKQLNYKSKYEKLKILLQDTNNSTLLKTVGQYFSKNEANILMKNNNSILRTSFDNFEMLDDINDTINKILAIDYKTYLPDDILTKVDRATMSVSLEGREPLLDYRIIEFVSQLPSSLKYRNGDKKWLLKQITHKYIPKTIMDRPKMGFGAPLQEWFQEELKQYFSLYLTKERLEKENIFNVDEILKLKEQYLQNDNEYINKLWLILVFEMWYEKWM